MTQRSQPRILAIANQKGGVGKTTTAINLGTGLAQAGLSCLLVDLDPQGNASTGLGLDAADRGSTLYDVFNGEAKLTETVVESSVAKLNLSPATIDLSGISEELIQDPKRAYRLRQAIAAEDAALSHFDMILIDCPPSLNLLTINALAAADGVIVPLQCEFFALEGLSQLLSTVRGVQQSANPDLRIHGIVLTMFDRRNRLSFQVEQDVRQNLGDVVYQTVIPRNVRLSEAPSHAMPALIYDEACAGSRAYRSLAAEVIAQESSGLAA